MGRGKKRHCPVPDTFPSALHCSKVSAHSSLLSSVVMEMQILDEHPPRPASKLVKFHHPINIPMWLSFPTLWSTFCFLCYISNSVLFVTFLWILSNMFGGIRFCLWTFHTSNLWRFFPAPVLPILVPLLSHLGTCTLPESLFLTSLLLVLQGWCVLIPADIFQVSGIRTALN